jgi:hypothetical protein
MDMKEPDAPDIDRRLQEAFGDDAAAAARVARAALADEDARGSLAVPRTLTADAARPRRRWAAVAAGAAVLLVASALVWWPAPPLTAPGVEPPTQPDAALVLSGSILDGALIVSLPDGSTSIYWGAARNDRPPDGSGIVIVEGVVR